MTDKKASKPSPAKATAQRSKTPVRTMRRSDRDLAAEFAQQYRAGQIDGEFLAGALEVLAEDGTFAVWQRAVDVLLNDYAARLRYKELRAVGMSQNGAIEALMKTHDRSERTIRKYVYRKPGAKQ